MRRERTDHERLTDNAVLLSLWAMAQQHGGTGAAGDRLKLMKLAFLAAYPLYLDRVKALNLRFYQWNRGPVAGQVYDTWQDLTARGLLLGEEEFVVTDEGMRLAVHSDRLLTVQYPRPSAYSAGKTPRESRRRRPPAPALPCQNRGWRDGARRDPPLSRRISPPNSGRGGKPASAVGGTASSGREIHPFG